MIITTTVKPFYGTTTIGSGLNRLINGIDARWHGLKTTLIMPHTKQPSAAIAVPPAIHSLMVRKNVSSMNVSY